MKRWLAHRQLHPALRPDQDEHIDTTYFDAITEATRLVELGSSKPECVATPNIQLRRRLQRGSSQTAERADKAGTPDQSRLILQSPELLATTTREMVSLIPYVLDINS